MILGILTDTVPETRVAVTPDAIKPLLDLGFTQILVEKDAGKRAFYSNADYESKGASLSSAVEIWKTAQVVVKINAPTADELAQTRAGQVIIGQMAALGNPELVAAVQKSQCTAFSLDLLPRSTRAQSMDVLSSMATVAGYQAVLTAAAHLPGFFPMFMTAAGTIKPSKVLIIGAGVAGLQAIATARKLGAIVEAFDVRAAAKEEVMSLGAKFVDVEGAAESAAAGGYAIEQSEDYKKRQAEAVHKHAAQADVIICTAQIPGRKAPLIVHQATVEAMKSGSVIVDMAASSGGNCAVTKDGETIDYKGVTVIGDSNLPAAKPRDASFMFSKNVQNFLKLLVKDGGLNLDFEDDIVLGGCVAHNEEVLSPRLASLVGA